MAKKRHLTAEERERQLQVRYWTEQKRLDLERISALESALEKAKVTFREKWGEEPTIYDDYISFRK